MIGVLQYCITVVVNRGTVSSTFIFGLDLNIVLIIAQNNSDFTIQ